jgi:hypothetical protein
MSEDECEARVYLAGIQEPAVFSDFFGVSVYAFSGLSNYPPFNNSKQHLQPTLKCLFVDTVRGILSLYIEQAAQTAMPAATGAR